MTHSLSVLAQKTYHLAPTVKGLWLDVFSAFGFKLETEEGKLFFFNLGKKVNLAAESASPIPAMKALVFLWAVEKTSFLRAQ